MKLKAYDVILEHKDTQKIQFMKIEHCKDMDECISYIHECCPHWWIERIAPANKN